MIQTLSENDIPLTHIFQLSGHKNLKSIENYSKVSTKQQMKMFQVLSRSVVTGTATKTSSYEKANPAISPSTSGSKLTQQESSSPEALPRWKRLRPLEDSDDE